MHQHVTDGLAVVTDEETELRLRLTETNWTLEDRGPELARKELQILVQRAQSYPDVVALCRAQVALTHLRAGELTSAARELDDVDDTTLASIDRVRVLLNRGTLAAHLEPGSGEKDLWEAYTVATEAQLEESAFRALHNLGWSAFLRGDLPSALDLMRRADALDADVDRSVAVLDLARVQLEAGLAREARAALTSAASGAAELGQQHTAGEVELELSRTHLLLGDREAAVDACRRARVHFAGLKADAWAGRARLREIVAAGADEWRLAGDDLDHLIAELIELGDSARAEGDEAAWIAGTLARARLTLASGRLDETDAALDSLGPAGTDTAAYLTTRLAVLDLRTRLALTRGERRRAVRTLNRGAAELAEARARPASLDLRTAVGAHSRSLATMDLDLAAATNRPWSLLGASERWRPGGDELPPVLPPRDPEAGELTRTLRSLREKIRLSPPGVDTRPLLRSARRLEQQVRALDWSRAGQPGASGRRMRPQGVRVAQLAEVLAAHDRALVSFIPVGDTLQAVVVAPGAGAVGVNLGSLAATQELVARVRAGITSLATARVPDSLLSAVRASLMAELDELAGLLVAPLLRRLPAEVPLVVVPTSLLGNPPWGMLPGLRGRPVVLARSATAWCRGRSADQQRLASPQVLPEVGSIGAMAGPGLPCGAQELTALAQIHPGPVRTISAGDSSAQGLGDLLSSCSTVHIAAHGVHDHDNPLFSYVRTAEGPAFAHEFLHDRVAATHVVVAACEGGRASFRPGEEPLGFAATLLSRGVTTVVAPTSVVPDEDAHALVLAHHRLLAAGVDPVTALARATEQSPLLAGSFSAFGAG